VTELVVFVEGHTEEVFVKTMLAPHLETSGVGAWRLLPTSRDPRTGQVIDRGGGGFKAWGEELKKHLRDGRPDLRFTTLWDLYALPRGFPGHKELGSFKDTREKASYAEAKLAEHFGDSRLIPYIQRHEIETLLFADLDALKRFLDGRDRKAIEALQVDVRSLEPEDIDDGPNSSPSNRLKKAFRFQKTPLGTDALQAIGLARIRERCPRFNEWVSKLEALGQGA
jgi:hypothetical protein